jgi:hypothetical protein
MEEIPFDKLMDIHHTDDLSSMYGGLPKRKKKKAIKVEDPEEDDKPKRLFTPELLSSRINNFDGNGRNTI